ncbi:hypothetical protein [Pelobium manganitolerans]|uniref:hypothetical protein n=1 Tax=Pelobium manganitolerans TaxID=1842495 RepID=UPI003FA3D208
MKNVEIAQLYETLLCSPGMQEAVKVDFRISRKSILLLSQIISKAFAESTSAEDFAGAAGKEANTELRETINTCLEKAGLSELNQRLLNLRKM